MSSPSSPPPEAVPRRSTAPEAVADMRATARWTIAAAAGVGSVLLGGVPLVAIGKVHGGWHIALAAVALALALLGVAWAIWRTGEALMPRFATLRDLDQPSLRGLRDEIAAAPEVFYGPFGSTPQELTAACRYHATVAVRLEDALALETDPRRVAAATRALAAARANLRNATARREDLLDLVHAWLVAAAVRRARLHTLGGAFLVVASAVLFLTVTTTAH